MKNNKGFALIPTLVVLVFIFVIGSISLAGLGNVYSFLFSKTVEGKVSGIDKIQPNYMGNNTNVSFSSAIAITQKDGEIITSSAEDRQWFVVEKGQCVQAKLYPYAPWVWTKSGTYYGARLIKIIPCAKDQI